VSKSQQETPPVVDKDFDNQTRKKKKCKEDMLIYALKFLENGSVGARKMLQKC
jgi:hypothetical protein